MNTEQKNNSTIISLVYEKTNDVKTTIIEFELSAGCDADKSFRAAIQEYLKTKQGKTVAQENGNDFNWGDAMLCVPNEIWEKHGLKMLDSKPVVYSVNHDENLYIQ